MCPMFFQITTFLLLCLCCSLIWSTRRQLKKETHEAFNRGVKYGYEASAAAQRAKNAIRKRRTQEPTR